MVLGGTSRDRLNERILQFPNIRMEVAMLERFFTKPQTVDGIMACWLGPQIDQYVTALCEQDYASRSVDGFRS